MRNCSSQHPGKVVLSAVNSSPFHLSSPNSGGPCEEWGPRAVVVTSETSWLSHYIHKSEVGSGSFLWVLGSVSKADVLLFHSLIIIQKLKNQVCVGLNPNHFYFTFPSIRLSTRFNILQKEIGRTEAAWCYSLNVSQFICWNPNSKVLELEDGTFRRWLGHKGRTHLKEISVLIREAWGSSLAPSTMRKDICSWIRKWDPTRHRPWPWGHPLPASSTMRSKLVIYKLPSLWYFRYSSPNRLSVGGKASRCNI